MDGRGSDISQDDWKDTRNIPDDTAISTVVKLQAK
jgi:hypothetical protein